MNTFHRKEGQFRSGICNRSDHWENILIYGACWGSCGTWDMNTLPTVRKDLEPADDHGFTAEELGIEESQTEREAYINAH